MSYELFSGHFTCTYKTNKKGTTFINSLQRNTTEESNMAISWSLVSNVLGYPAVQRFTTNLCTHSAYYVKLIVALSSPRVTSTIRACILYMGP